MNLLGGGDKSSQTQDIKTAQALWQKFEEKGSPEETLLSWSQAAVPEMSLVTAFALGVGLLVFGTRLARRRPAN